MVNTASAPATIDAATLNGDPSFAIAADDCSGVALGAGRRCTITIDFAPTAIGEAATELVIGIVGGRELSARLDGVGARPPQLSVFPASARGGQVVTVRGEGFPTGLVVEVTAGLVADDVVVDPTGAFAHPLVVMANTPSGPIDVMAAGQIDQFDDVVAEMFVRERSDDSGSSVLVGAGVNVRR